MRVLITGINGFVGSYLKTALISKGHEVFGLDVTSFDRDVFVVDITKKDEVSHLFRNIKPDAVMHLAGIAKVDFEHCDKLYTINTMGTLNLLSASVLDKTKFIFISSSQVYGNVSKDYGFITENNVVMPINHYGASKAAAENMVQAFINEYDLPAVIVRPFNHTGRGQTENFVVPKIVNAFKNKQDTIELGNINTERDFLDVRDVVNAYGLILDNFKSGSIYNVASGNSIKISDIIERLREITGHDLSISVNNNFVRKSEINCVIGASEKLKKDTGWEVKYQIDDTLKEMLL